MPSPTPQLVQMELPARRARGRPELPEDERKTRATFSITRRTLEQFYQVCELNHLDSNREVEAYMARFIEEHGNIEVLRLRREELMRKLEENRKKIDALSKNIS